MKFWTILAWSVTIVLLFMAVVMLIMNHTILDDLQTKFAENRALLDHILQQHIPK